MPSEFEYKDAWSLQEQVIVASLKSPAHLFRKGAKFAASRGTRSTE